MAGPVDSVPKGMLYFLKIDVFLYRPKIHRHCMAKQRERVFILD